MSAELVPLMTTGHPALPQTIVVFNATAVSVGLEIPAFGKSLLVSGSYPQDDEMDPTGQIALGFAMAEAMGTAAEQLKVVATYELTQAYGFEEEDEEEDWDLDPEDEDDDVDESFTDWGASPAFDVIAPYLTGRALSGVGSWMPKLTVLQVDLMTDEELLKRSGVGAATVEHIRQAIRDHARG